MVLAQCSALALLIRTQESVAMLADWMDTTRMFHTFSENDRSNTRFCYSAGNVVGPILYFIHNPGLKERIDGLQPDTFWKGDYGVCTITKEQIVLMRQWLKENKGKFQL